MSFADFNDFYDICMGMTELEEEVVRKPKPRIERFEFMGTPPPHAYRWWEEAIREIESERKEKERGLVHV